MRFMYLFLTILFISNQPLFGIWEPEEIDPLTGKKLEAIRPKKEAEQTSAETAEQQTTILNEKKQRCGRKRRRQSKQMIYTNHINQ